MPQRMVQLERLSGQVDRLSAQTVAALRASKKQTVRVAKKVTELEDHEVSASVQTGAEELVLARAVKNLEQWSDEVSFRHVRPLEDRVAYLEQCCL